MLVLTRRIGETFHIGDDIKITLLGIKGGQSRIGIEAPKGIPVHREEIYKRIAEEKKRAALFPKPDYPVINCMDEVPNGK